MASEETRTTLAEKIRKLPMSVFNSKDLSEMTTHMMGDVSTAEHALSHVIPQHSKCNIDYSNMCAWLSLIGECPLPYLFLYNCFYDILGRMIYGKQQKHAAAHLAASGQVQSINY